MVGLLPSRRSVPPSAAAILGYLANRRSLRRSVEAVTIESVDWLLHVSHNGAIVATHARRHLIDDDDKMDRRRSAAIEASPSCEHG
jgi:hypothetical protein